MEEIRKILANYDLDDIYNMDKLKTGYYFALQPDQSLTSEQLEGRITVALICNSTGSDRLPPWIIGMTENSQCFKNINCATLRCY